MEEGDNNNNNNNNHPSEINSVDVNKILRSSIVYLNKKRKFQSEQSGLPLPKHKCWDRGLNSKCDNHSSSNVRVEDFNLCAIKGKTVCGERDDESGPESGKGSNSFGGDMDTATSAYGEAKIQSEYPKTYPSDRPSNSSVNWGSGGSFKNNLYSLDSRSVTKSGADIVQLQSMGGDHNFPYNDFGLHTCLNFDEHLMEFEKHIDYNCLEHGNENIEQCTNKELEDMSNELPPNNYVLSSGRWSVEKETQPSTNNLTIDKEFEQYFSMLML